MVKSAFFRAGHAFLLLLFGGFGLGACSNGGDAAAPIPSLSTEERLAAPADPARGQVLFSECAVCHEAQKGARHRLGPTLWGVYGQPAAQLADFRYSGALRRSGVVWTDEALDTYLKSPQSLVPGWRMSYPGMENPADRRDLIAFLATLDE